MVALGVMDGNGMAARQTAPEQADADPDNGSSVTAITTGAASRHLPRSLSRQVKAVLFVDVVEFVRLIEQDEDGTVRRWMALVDTVARKIVPACGGRLVRRLGDGLLLRFDDVPAAVATAFAIRHAASHANRDVPPDRQIRLRMGLELGAVLMRHADVYGHGVNLAQRLMTLAGPDEIVVSAHARDRLVPELDAEVEDLGECFVKHVREPVRAYRIGPPGPSPVLAMAQAPLELRPTLAVVPFDCRSPDPAHDAIGDTLAEEVIRALSRSPEVDVISRLSSGVFRNRRATAQEIGAHLHADYVLSGTYACDARHVTLDAELAEGRSGRIVWSERLVERRRALLRGDRDMISRIVAELAGAVMSRELERSKLQPLPSLKAYTLLLAAIALMNRLSLRDFDQARHLLQTLVDRAPRQAVPQAWLANWHVLRVQQGWSADPDVDASLALECSKRALDADPTCSLALAIDGFVHTNLLRRFDIALERYTGAIAANPSDALAWLLKGTLHAFTDQGTMAVLDTERALKLSPLDPRRWFYDSLAASAHLTAGDHERALELSHRSLRSNRHHTSTLRVMTVAQWELGRTDEARRTAAELLRLQPSLTVSGYLRRAPSASFAIGQKIARVLGEAGVPA